MYHFKADCEMGFNKIEIFIQAKDIYWFFRNSPVFNFLDLIGLSITLITFFLIGKRISFSGKKLVIFFYTLFFLLTLISTFSSYLKFPSLFFSNLILYNLTPIFLLAPLFFFFRIHIISVSKKRLSFFVFLAIIFYYAVTLKKISADLNLFYYLFFSFFVMVNSFSYLMDEVIYTKGDSAYSKIEFWFIGSLFFYASICLLVWSLYDWLLYSLQDPSDVSIIWSTLHNGTLFIHCIIFSTALLWNRIQKN